MEGRGDMRIENVVMVIVGLYAKWVEGLHDRTSNGL